MSSEALLDRPMPIQERSASLTTPGNTPVTIIERRSRWMIVDWQELREYRDLFVFLVWRGIKIRYAQSTLGIGWAVLQPLVTTLVFTVIFGNLAGIDSGGIPYALLSLSGLVPWTYYANALTDGTNSLVANANIIGKVYFPRVVLPLAAVVSRLVDFAISAILLVLLMAWYQTAPASVPGLLVLPLLVVLMMLTAAGVSMWLTALAVQYRDVKHAMTFVVQILMYAAPVVYPTTLIPEQYRLLYALNPMVGVIEGFRAVLFGSGAVPWTYIGLGTASAVVIAITGSIYFHRKERLFADVA